MFQGTLLLLSVFALLQFAACTDEDVSDDFDTDRFDRSGEEDVMDGFDLINYENLTKEFNTIPAFGCNGTAVSDFIRFCVLNGMNTIRSFVALGRYKSYGLSSSNDMNKLRWDCELESIAKKAVQDCPKNASFLKTENAINFN
ncbi:hypothetical protein KIN20_016611 [Parelaphostrongylus tenuis]|uniref:SCP domain-containing protein n=1 Tax=Parelaphostrongylus tenuis TaxID=148309 RepID=A0AAD5MGP2_PARTN|nr:hypothetical protein KIN20_016611 [Parelaphostrongylus tenuis]